MEMVMVMEMVVVAVMEVDMGMEMGMEMALVWMHTSSNTMTGAGVPGFDSALNLNRADSRVVRQLTKSAFVNSSRS